MSASGAIHCGVPTKVLRFPFLPASCAETPKSHSCTRPSCPTSIFAAAITITAPSAKARPPTPIAQDTAMPVRTFDVAVYDTLLVQISQRRQGLAHYDCDVLFVDGPRFHLLPARAPLSCQPSPFHLLPVPHHTPHTEVEGNNSPKYAHCPHCRNP